MLFSYVLHKSSVQPHLPLALGGGERETLRTRLSPPRLASHRLVILPKCTLALMLNIGNKR